MNWRDELKACLNGGENVIRMDDHRPSTMTLIEDTSDRIRQDDMAAFIDEVHGILEGAFFLMSHDNDN